MENFGWIIGAVIYITLGMASLDSKDNSFIKLFKMLNLIILLPLAITISFFLALIEFLGKIFKFFTIPFIENLSEFYKEYCVYMKE